MRLLSRMAHDAPSSDKNIAVPESESHSRTELTRQLTHALETQRGFSFLRLGDGELQFLLQCQRGEWMPAPAPTPEPGIECATVHSGLRPENYHRLLRSYEHATWVDLYLFQRYNAAHFSHLKWSRPARNVTLTQPEHGGIILDWVDVELPQYVRRNLCLFCGAEAPLLAALLRKPEYRHESGYWPDDAKVEFETPPNGGRTLAEDLGPLLERLKARIESERIHTVFLALGGLAKIVAVELATTTGVRAVDIGGALRGLCYAGSDGHTTWRASHNPFFFRVPFVTYWAALLEAYPALTNSEQLAKAHAQLALEVQRKSRAATVSADVHDPTAFDPSPANLAAFDTGLRFYHRRILPITLRSISGFRLARQFVWWRWKKGLGGDGKIFQRARLSWRKIRGKP